MQLEGGSAGGFRKTTRKAIGGIQEDRRGQAPLGKRKKQARKDPSVQFYQARGGRA